MLGIKKLLVGVALERADENPDELVLPPPTRAAVEIALQSAASSSAELTFFTVNDVAAEEEEAASAAAQQRLGELVEEAAQGGVTARAQVAAGTAWVEIIREVLRSGQQMVIVGSRKQSATRRLLLGSTGMKLLRKCPCPVWIVRSEAKPTGGTVIVADELTEVGERCLQLGVAAARLLDAKLLVLHAAQYPQEWQLRRTGTSPDEIDDYREKIRHDAEQALNNRLAMTDARTLTQGVRMEVNSGSPELVIEDAIEEHAADLLVMGTVARGGMAGMFVGNTAERVLPAVSCSLLAVKPDDFVCPIKLD